MLFVLLLLAIAALLIGGWGFTTGRAKEDACARCKYPVEGLSADTCPECGSSLRAEGTRRKGAPLIRRPPTEVALVCRTIIVGGIALIAVQGQIDEAKITVMPATATASSRAGLFSSIEVEARPEWRTRDDGNIERIPRRPDTTAVLKGPERTVRLRVIDPAARCEYDQPGGPSKTPDAITPDEILAWMRHAGADTTHPDARAEAESIVQLIRNAAAGGRELDRSTTVQSGLANLRGTSGMYSYPDWRALLLIAAAAITAWWLMVRRLHHPRPASPKKPNPDDDSAPPAASSPRCF